MKLFVDEKEMQSWLENEISKHNSLTDLIDVSKTETSPPSSRTIEIIEESYRYCLNSLGILEVIAANENICLTKKETLKPDILAYAPETESIVIIELKNITGPTREAGTELSAYCSEVNNYLPFISDADIINVIISNEWPTLLRRHVIQDILWRGRKLLCLRPYKSAAEIRLKIVSPKDLGCSETDLKLGTNHIGGYQLCLYDKELYSKDANRARLDQYLPQMRSAMSAMAAKGNLSGNHGFAFLWKDKWQESLAPYSITILNVAAFNRLDRFIFDLSEREDLSDMQERFIKIAGEYVPSGHGQSLHEITKEAKRFVDGFCSPQTEGFLSWSSLSHIMEPRAEYVSFTAWGFFGERHLELLNENYKKGDDVAFDSPELGLELIATVIDPDVPSIDLAHFLFDVEDEDEDAWTSIECREDN